MLPNIYKGDYRLLAVLPVLLLLASLYFIPSIRLGVDFQGGTLLTLSMKESINTEELQSKLQQEGHEATVRSFKTNFGYQVEIEVPQNTALVKADKLKQEFNSLLPEVSQLEVQSYSNSTQSDKYLEKKSKLGSIAGDMFLLEGKGRSLSSIKSTNDLAKALSAAYTNIYTDYQASISEPIQNFVQYDSISVQSVSPALSTHFIEVATKIVMAAIVLSFVLVFLFFRDVMPSIAVLTGAVSDIVIALGGMGLLGVPLTLASFAALLMLVGFALDTDILLTTRMLKRKGDARDHAFDAMKTGMTMSIAAIIAFLALFILSAITHIPTYYEISAVALAGLVGDLFATWGINAVMMLHYVENRDKTKLSSGGRV